MYLTRNQEIARNCSRMWGFVVLVIPAITLVASLYYIPISILTETTPVWILSILTIITSYHAVMWLIKKMFLVIEGNKRLLTHNPLSPRTLAGDPDNPNDMGEQTDPNEYGPGFHVLWPWEQEIETVSLETDISEKFDQVISSIRGDTPTMEIEFDVEPDPKLCPQYILNGTSEEERKGNIVKRVTATVRGEVEVFLSEYKVGRNSLDIDNLFKRLGDIKTGLDEHFHKEGSRLLDECHAMGVRLKKVRIGDINRSDDNQKAIRIAESVKKYRKEVKKTMKENGSSSGEAWASTLSIADEIEGKGYIFGVPETVIEGLGKISKLLSTMGGNKTGTGGGS